MLPVPRIDSRTSDEVVQQILKLLLSYSGASQADPQAVFSADKGARSALIEIFGRFAELIIERLNQVPGTGPNRSFTATATARPRAAHFPAG